MHVQVTIKLRNKTGSCGNLDKLPEMIDKVLGEMAELSDKFQIVKKQIGKAFQLTCSHNLVSVAFCMMTVLGPQAPVQ